MISANTYFVVPIEHFNTETNNFVLMPDNGDDLPIDKLFGIVCWNGYIENPKLALNENNEIVPRNCVLVLTQLDTHTIMSIKTQTTEFMSLESFEQLEQKYPEASLIVAEEAKNNLTMTTVQDLMITKIYAGRTPEEVVWLWPELEGKILKVEIA